MSKVLVTGGSGFVGCHCVRQLLAAGYEVRASVRNLQREGEVREMLRHGGVDAGGQLSFAAADLAKDNGWREAVAGCDYVLHVASPFPAGTPAHEDELIIPAREGTLRILRAAREAGVKRVVMTSSFGAIGYGHPPRREAFTEADWTDVNGPDVMPYVKSKTLAEQAAWDFVAREGSALELSVINPVGIFGPVLSRDVSSSIAIVQRMLEGRMKFCPRVFFGVVDVRDVADLHLRAMTRPAAKGERFLAVAGGCLSMLEVAKILRQRLGGRAAKVPRTELPNWLVRLLSRWQPALRGVVPQLGKVRLASNEKARRVLGWSPRSSEEALVETALSLFDLKLVRS